jgi:Rrf2 family iron-sulfur cluster assembly transcriptional regulator
MMKLNKSTRYALYAAMELAGSDPDEQVTAAGVAERYGISTAVVAKVFPQLARSGIAVGLRGSGGGYRLARSPSEVTVLDVIEAFEPPRPGDGCLLAAPGETACEQRPACRLKSLFDEVDEMARCTFASITLETLVGRLTFSRVSSTPSP